MSEPLSFIDGLAARLNGPMNFRLPIQPLMAGFFAFRDGRRDAREGQPPFSRNLFTEPERRRGRVKNGWKSVGKVFAVAVVLGFVFQYKEFCDLRPTGALIAGVVLALAPYLALRGPVNRLSRRRGR